MTYHKSLIIQRNNFNLKPHFFLDIIFHFLYHMIMVNRTKTSSTVENLGGYRQAIITRYHGPTNTRGARISATSGCGIKVSIPYPDDVTGLGTWPAGRRALNDLRHFRAVEALCNKMGWSGKLINGGLDKGQQVWVFADVRALDDY